MKLSIPFLSKKISVFFSLLIFITASVIAQTVVVSGEVAEKDLTTKIILNAVDGISMDIYQVFPISTTSSSSETFLPDGSKVKEYGSSSTSTKTYLCSTPAELILDKGEIYLQARFQNEYTPFTVRATGGTQIFDVRAPKPIFAAGICCVVFGGIATVAASVCGSILCDFNFLWLGAAGLGAIGAGIPMIINGRTKITLVEIKF